MTTKIFTLKEVDILIQKYKKKPSKEISLELFKAFEGFILKYTHFLKYGSIKNNDKDLLGLAKLLDIKDFSNNPIKKIFETWDLHDIFNELYLLFLKSINQFTKRKSGPYFTGYLYNYYKYMVKNWIQSISKDILNINKTIDIENIPEIGEEEIDIQEYDNLCLTEKTSLTQFEKYILYLYYGKKMTEQEIGDLLGVVRVHIHRLKKKAKNKLLSSGIILDDLKVEN